ncbi:hypothetical protein HDU86_007247 [Geranomyces michiganensis]|nr:hypothetical protein HDU86_007247 [Geranomyces michiganensis]
MTKDSDRGSQNGGQTPNEAVPEARVTAFFEEPVELRPVRGACLKRELTAREPAPRNEILERLRTQWQSKLDGTYMEEEAISTSLKDTIDEIRQESDAIQTVRKERVFDDEVTEEEMNIIQQRVALQQRQFREYQRREAARKVAKVRSMFDFLKKQDIEAALGDANEDEDTVILNFAQPDYLITLRKTVALKHQAEQPVQYDVLLTTEQQQAYERRVEKRKQAPKKTTTEDAKKRCMKFARLRLDEALSQLQNGADPEKGFEGWSDARVRAYQQIKTKPNSYYYRFNAPGEKQRNGAWTQEERALFFKQLEERGADGQWGIFSMAIPGRVGYQCSNFYRGLLKSKQIVDDNYTLDDKGELRYLFGKKEGGEGVIRSHSKHGSGGAAARPSRSVAATPSVAKKRKRKSARMSDDDDGEDGNIDDLFDQDDSGTYSCKTSWATTRRTRAKAAAEEALATAGDGDDNPLPGFTDPITLDEVVKPAISPYGHVMSYQSWIRCLSSEDRKNICPLTKKPLTKRELVVLTHENIEEYRSKIVNS